MASTVTKTFTENYFTSGNTQSNWTVTLTGQDVTVTGSTFQLSGVPANNVTFKYVGSNKGRAASRLDLLIKPNGASDPSNATQYGLNRGYNIQNASAATSGTTYASVLVSDVASTTYNTSSYFTSSNKTSKTVSIIARYSFLGGYSHNSSFNGYDYTTGNYNSYRTTTAANLGTVGTITLNAPPTYTATVSSSAPYYSGVSTYSVSIASLSAKYGGDISQVKLTVGSQTATRTTNGTLSINLNKVGTFTPTVEVTDSRGQKTTKTLSAITVNAYSIEIQDLSVQRIDGNDQISDDGTHALITVKIGYTKYSGNYLLAPITKNGNTELNTVTWYTSWSNTNGFSGAVNWTNYAPNSPITLYGKCTSTFNVNSSYTINVTPRATYANGVQISRKLLQAFYLLAGRAGGRALGIGMKPRADGTLDIALDVAIFGYLTESLVLKRAGIDASKADNNVSSTAYPTQFCIVDKENRTLARLEGEIAANGNIGSKWYVRNYDTNGAQVAQKGITITMTKSGVLTVVTQGDITINKSAAIFAAQGTINTRVNATTPSSATIVGGLNVKDSNGDIVFYNQTTMSSTDTLYSTFITRRYNADGSAIAVTHGFYQHVNKNGNLSVNFTSEASRTAWRTGLLVDKWENTDYTTTTATDFFEVSSSVATVSSGRCRKFGKVVYVFLTWTNKNAITVPDHGNIANITIGTLKSGYRPHTDSTGISYGDNAGQQWYAIRTTGVIELSACEGTGTQRTIAAGSTFRCMATFITP